MGGFGHELHSFVDGLITLRDYEMAAPIVRGDDLFRSIIGEGVELNGIADAAREEGIDLVGTFFMTTTVGGRVVDSVYEMARDEILAGIGAAGPDVAGVMLPLHGAMATESLDDVEGDFLPRVRELVGPDVPIAVSFDMHVHGTQRMAEAADILVCYRTCPHTDYYDTGARTLRLLARAVRREIRPTTVLRKLRLMTTSEVHDTNHGPMVEIQQAARALEARPRILAVSVFATQPWMDVPELGWSVVVVADGDRGAAEAVADELGWTIWNMRDRLRFTKTPPAEAIRAAEESAGIPVVFSDGADSTTAGSHGDGNHLLRALLDAGYRGTAQLAIVDCPAVQACIAAGIGAEISVEVGGTLSPAHFTPLRVTGRVVTLAEGRYELELPIRPRDVGRIAVLEVGGISVVLTEEKAPQLDMSIFHRAGLNPLRSRIVQAKSAGGFRGAYEPHAAAVYDVDFPGPCDHDLTRLPFSRIPRPMWPWDPDLDEPWAGAGRPPTPARAS